MLRLKSGGFLALMTVLLGTPAIAVTANFASLKLTPGFPPAKAVVTGSTDGSVSLSSIKTSDRNNNPCIGYGAPTPDHIIVLQKDFPSLTLKVDTRGKDTTLIVKGPNDVFRCGDDTGSSKDASVSDTNWKAGEYRVWVGSLKPGQKWNYTLSAQE